MTEDIGKKYCLWNEIFGRIKIDVGDNIIYSV